MYTKIFSPVRYQIDTTGAYDHTAINDSVLTEFLNLFLRFAIIVIYQVGKVRKAVRIV